jgi:hypothetical protein
MGVKLKKTIFILFMIVTFAVVNALQCEDKIVLKSGKEYYCHILTTGQNIEIIDENKVKSSEYINNIAVIYMKDVGKIYDKEDGYLIESDRLQKILSKRQLRSRTIGIIAGSGFFILDGDIHDHMGQQIGPIFFETGFEVPIHKYHINLQVSGKFGLGGNIVNSYKEKYSFADFGLNFKWLPPTNNFKQRFILKAGINYVSADIDDNADGNYTHNGVDVFNPGTLNASASSLGFSFGTGLSFNLSRNFEIVGLVNFRFVKLDFEEFITDSVEPGFELKLIYYPAPKNKYSNI